MGIFVFAATLVNAHLQLPSDLTDSVDQTDARDQRAAGRGKHEPLTEADGGHDTTKDRPQAMDTEETVSNYIYHIYIYLYILMGVVFYSIHALMRGMVFNLTNKHWRINGYGVLVDTRINAWVDLLSFVT